MGQASGLLRRAAACGQADRGRRRLVFDHLAEFGIGQRRGGLRAPRSARAAENAGAGRLSISRSRSVSRTKSCTNVPCRKRTSVFEGCTLTSTSSGVAFQEQQRERKRRRRNQVVIRRGKRVQQQAVADEAAVDENVNRIAVALLHLRPREEAREAEGAGGRLVGFGSVVRNSRVGGTLGAGSSSSFSRTPISTRSSSAWLPKTW